MVKKIKVLYVITRANFGGAQKYVHDLAISLPKENFEAVVVFGGNGVLPEKLKSAGIREISIPSLGRDVSFWNDLKTLVALVKLFRTEQPDIIHLNSTKAAGLGSLAVFFIKTFQKFTKRRARPKLIFTIHGSPENEDRPFLVRSLIKTLSWLTIIFSDQAICVSKKDLESLRQLPFISKKLIAIHNGIASRIFSDKITATDEIVKLLKLKNDFLKGKIIIGTVAELTKNKGLNYAVKAMKSAPKETVLIIIGEGEKQRSLQEQIKNLDLSERIFLTGLIPDAARLMKVFDIFLLPSVKEGLPYVILEAGLARLPVVATDVGGVSEIISDMTSGIVVRSKAPEEIAKALTYLIQNPDKQKLFAAALEKEVTEKFSLERMLEKTLTTYKL